MITVFGASDDLIEVEGDNLCEEFSVYDSLSRLTFSDGTILDVEYSKDGVWKINHQAGTGSSTVVKKYDADENSESLGYGYSDIVTIDGVITSVRLSKIGAAK